MYAFVMTEFLLVDSLPGSSLSLCAVTFCLPLQTIQSISASVFCRGFEILPFGAACIQRLLGAHVCPSCFCCIGWLGMRLSYRHNPSAPELWDSWFRATFSSSTLSLSPLPTATHCRPTSVLVSPVHTGSVHLQLRRHDQGLERRGR